MRATHDGQAEERVLGEAPEAPAGLWERVLGAIDDADADLGLLPADEDDVGDPGGGDPEGRPAGIEQDLSRLDGHGREHEADDGGLDRERAAGGGDDAHDPGDDAGRTDGAPGPADDPFGSAAPAEDRRDDLWGDDDGLG